MNADAVVERPLTIAEIFDRALAVCVRRWRAVLVLGAIIAIPDTVTRAFDHGRLPAGTNGAWLLLLDLALCALGSAVLVRLFGDPDAPRRADDLRRAAVDDFWRAFLSSLTAGGLWLAAFALGFLAVGGVFVLGRDGGSLIGGTIAAAILAVPVLGLLAPLTAALSIAFPITILERAGPWQGIVLGWRRARAAGLRRSCLVGAAMLFALVAPYFAGVTAFDGLADATGWWWLKVLEPISLDLVAWSFGSAFATIAAIDYRNRTEGSDRLASVRHVPAP